MVRAVKSEKWNAEKWFEVSTLTILFAGVFAVAIYGFQYGGSASLTVVTAGFMTAGASLLVGGLLGFLFGIPRSQAQPDRRTVSNGSADHSIPEEVSRYSANTNLEQISDWLTKILVGVGLTQLPSIRRGLHDLVTFLAPALGGRPDSPVFAFALVMYFLTSGFVLGYLWSRIVLPGQFAAADELAGLSKRLAKAEQATENVRKSVEEQARIDAQVLSMVSALLNPTPGSPTASQEELDDSVRKASPAIRVQIFNQAQLQRIQNWREPNDLPKMERTIPVFRALIAADDKGIYDRNHAQLGYALKDKRQPDYAEGEKELTEAIRIRGKTEVKGLLYYEFNRAFCRIMQDSDFLHGRKSNPESLQKILEDLRVVAAAGLALINDKKIEEFLLLNDMTVNDLTDSK